MLRGGVEGNLVFPGVEGGRGIRERVGRKKRKEG